MDDAPIIALLHDRTPLFREFPPDRLRALIAGSKLVTFEAQEAVIEFGEPGQFMGVLLAGEAEVSVADDAGVRRELARLQPGDTFGEMALLTGDRTLADVIGRTSCRALLIPQDLFTTTVVSFPPALRHLARQLGERARVVATETTTRQLQAAAECRSPDPYGLQLESADPQRLLVINCGSSSLKYSFYDTADARRTCRGTVEKIGGDGLHHVWRGPDGQERTADLPPGNHAAAFAAMLTALTAPPTGVLDSAASVTAVGHRVVHGGEQFANATIVTDAVLAELERLSALAPLHNPVNVAGIVEARRAFPRAVQVAAFDTAFHHTLPPYAYLYALPHEYYAQQGIRRYGFHGLSHAYVALRAAQFLQRPYNALEIVSCHLGNGASMCAIDHGRSVDTSMGLTPVEGLAMGTRCGDLDPAILLHLLRTENLTPDQLDTLINKESGLKGMSGISNDMREIERAAQAGDHRALLAIKIFCYRIRKYLGAYLAAMGGLDAIVFTGGIGQGSAGVRSLACQGLNCMGIVLDDAKNQAARGFTEITCISTADSPVKVLVVPTDEERMIARETLRALGRHHRSRLLGAPEQLPVPIEVSAHHVHLSRPHVEALFGAGHRLTRQADLSQPGQFACVEQVNLVGPKGRVERVRVLGPERPASQVEIAMTEQFKLGIQPPIRESGDLEHTPGIGLEGPQGTVTLDQGVICAMRHLHLAPADALKLGLQDHYLVAVRVAGDRELTFGDVVVRISPNYRLAMHLDTDEANAANLQTGAIGYVTAIQSQSAN